MALLGGRPLVEHTIRFALECGLLDTRLRIDGIASDPRAGGSMRRGRD